MPDQREITVKTALGDTLKFSALEGFDEVSRCFRYTLDLVSEEIGIDPHDLLGQPVTVSVGRPEAVRHFHGIVADFGMTGMRDDYVQFRATLRPTLWLLSNTTDNRIFQNMSVPDIVKEILAGVPTDFRLRGSYPPRDYCVQYGESDLDFVQRLLEHEGIFYFFEHSADGHTMVLCDEAGKLGPVPGFEEVPWERDSLVSFLDGDFVTAWAPVASVRSGAYTQTDYDFEKPSADLASKAKNAFGHKEDAAEVYHYPGNYVALGRGDTLARIRLEELQAPHRRVAAKGTVRGLWSGASFRLTDFPSEAEDDAYIVLRAEYRMWDDQYRAGMERADQGFEVALSLAPQALPFRPARRTPKPRMAGPQTAVVVGPAGSEIYTDRYSRVKVQFHWDRLGRKNENTSCFVRVSSAWAGAGWGFIQIPRIGQEVIVDFLEGDPDQPIITGRLYNAEQMPPYGLPGNATQSGWKSNSSPGGGGWNELRFEDKAGSEEVYFQAQKDHNELVKNDETRTIGHDWSEDVGHDARQTVGHNRAEVVKNDKSVRIDHNRTVSIGDNDSEEVGKNRSLAVGQNESITVGQDSTEEIRRNHKQTVGLAQMVLVKAGRSDKVGLMESRVVGSHQTITVGKKRSVRVGGKQHHHVQSDDSTEVKGGQTFKVHKDHSSDITGNQGLKLGGNQSFEIAGGRIVKVGKGQTHDVAEDLWLKAGKSMMIEAADSITLKTGDATIEMKKDGTITIKGKDISIVGSGKINAKADGDMILKGSNIHAN